MRNDEFAFFNQQLGGMLDNGIPLEGAIRRLCQDMRRSAVRDEFALLEKDLAEGTPLDAALERRSFPALYVRMVKVGLRGNALPQVLRQVADYFRSADDLWTRLKGLMVYPVLVLTLALAVSVFMAVMLGGIAQTLVPEWQAFGGQSASFEQVPYQVMLPPVVLTLALLALALGLAVPALRNRLRWRLPAFKDASLAQLARALAVMVKGGCPLAEAVGLMKEIESGSPVGADLEQWSARIAGGHAGFADIARGSRIIPPLFVWLVDSAGERLADGLESAAGIYHARATRQIDLMLYTVLPLSIVVLGAMLVRQGVVLTTVFVEVVRMISTF